eukprot:7558486-Pyramimonas_sp.AAC.1
MFEACKEPASPGPPRPVSWRRCRFDHGLGSVAFPGPSGADRDSTAAPQCRVGGSSGSVSF